MPALSFLSSTMERAKPAVARTSTGGKPTEMGVRYLSKNYAIELSHVQPPSLVSLVGAPWRSRRHVTSGWLAAALPPALLEGEDDALVDVAAFQLAVGLGGLLHGHGLVRAQAEPAIGQ